MAGNLDDETGGYDVEDKLIYFDLCAALSDIFVDSEVDFKEIASVARQFPVNKVECIFFEWVSPVCYTNLLTPVPPVWGGFDKKMLWDDICEYRNKTVLFKTIRHTILVAYLKLAYKKEWLALRCEILN